MLSCACPKSGMNAELVREEKKSQSIMIRSFKQVGRDDEKLPEKRRRSDGSCF